MINLPRIFRSRRLKSYINFLSIKQPTVVYKGVSTISSKIFNYTQSVKDHDSDIVVACGLQMSGFFVFYSTRVWSCSNG